MIFILTRLRKTLTKIVAIWFRNRKTEEEDEDDDNDPYGLDNFNYPLF